MIVGLITAATSRLLDWTGEDEARCDLATQFFVGYDDQALHTVEERTRPKAIYLEMAERNCLGG